MLQDLRHALRSLSSSRGFVAVSVSCLALGIGVNVAMFAIINALLLAPPPLADAARLVVLGEADRGNPDSFAPVSLPNFRDWQEGARDVLEMGALRTGRVRIGETEAADRENVAFTTPNLLALLGMSPLAGRGFDAADARQGAVPVVMLSETLWRQRFGEDRSVIGRSIDIDGVTHAIVGIVPALRHWTIPESMRDARAWAPLTPDEAWMERGRRALAVFARLSSGTTLEAAAARLDALGSALESRHMENAGRSIALRPLARPLGPRTRSMLATGFGGTVFVLLIACANAANLTLARTLTRRREVAVRTALGASRLRIVRQLLSESLVLGALAAPFGVLLGALALEALSRGLPELGARVALSIDARTLAFTIGLVLIIAVLSGLAPALQALRGATRDALGDTVQAVTAGSSQKRLRDLLVIGEVALSLVLLVAASLLIRSFSTLMQEDTVLDPRPLATLRIDLPDDRYATTAALASGVRALVGEAESTPGVEAATASDLVPLSGGGRRATLLFDDPGNGGIRTAIVQYGGVTARFFDTLGLSLVRGRGFTEAEASTRSGVVIVNERMADRLWPGDDPLGKRVRVAEDANAEWLTVIGVAPTLPNWSISGVPRPTAYVPFPYAAARNPLLIARASGDPVAAANAVSNAIEEADPALVVDVGSMTAMYEDQFWRQALFGRSFGVLGAIAVLLAATGLYGVLAHLVAERRREIGLRVALGAARGDVVRLVLGRGMMLVVAGVAIGVAGAVGLTKVMRGLLYGVSAADPLHFAGAALLLVGIGFVASGVPARRAAVANPLASLRD